jgi:site-specific DNA recombinase
MVPHPELSETPRIVLYARVSTEDQAERQTVQAQLDFLRNWASLYDLPIVGEYVDDGVSGTIPLADREYGGRLLAELPGTRPTKLVVYRLDRLGRSVRVLLDAHSALEQAGITIQSATEPFDTSSPIGRFVFQLLGSIAELERSTITERMTMGRDRVAKRGKWTGGPIPFGYDLDVAGCLIPSERLVPALGITDADLVRDLFERLAGGSTLVAECQRLTALGLPTARRYANGTTVHVTDEWRVARLSKMARNSVYYGFHRLRSRHGLVERAVPALVSRDLWDTVQRQLKRNRTLSTKNASRPYLLRGLITCEDCGRHFTGCSSHADYYYRCNSQQATVHLDPRRRCPAKRLQAAWLEGLVWQDCASFIRNPGEALHEAQQQLRARSAQAAGLEKRQQTLAQQLAEKDAERERVLTLFRRNRISVEEAERQLDSIAQEAETLRELRASLDAQAVLTRATEVHLTEAAALLSRLHQQLDEVEQTNNWDLRRQIIELLVGALSIRTEGSGRHKRALITIHYTFGRPSAVDSTRQTPGPTPGSGPPSMACSCWAPARPAC